jgi:hypothetical protein
MSDPAWASRVVIDGHDSRVWIQVGGTGTAPGDSDLLGFVTALDFSVEASVAEKGPYIHLATVKKTLSSYSASGSFSVDLADGTDAVLERLFTAIETKARIKITVQANPTTGVKEVFDQCVIGAEGNIDPGEGISYTFSFDSDSYDHTAASA